MDVAAASLARAEAEMRALLAREYWAPLAGRVIHFRIGGEVPP